MANNVYEAKAQPVCQVDTITFAGTWLAAETVTVTCNNKAVTLTGGTTLTTAALYAEALAELLMATTGDLVADGSGNVGGRSYGEFYDFNATVSGAVVTLTSSTLGQPFTVTVAETSVSGTATHGAEDTAATGPSHFDDANNWSDGVPTTDDVMIFDRGSTSLLYAIDTAVLDLNMIVRPGFTGGIGLPPIHESTSGLSYPEYRTRYQKMEPTGTTGTATINIDASSNGGGIYLDFGTNTNTTLTVTVRNAPAGLEIVGGKTLDLNAYNGTIGISLHEDQNATEIENLRLHGNATITIGETATFADVTDTITQTAGTINLEAACSQPNNELKIYGGLANVATTSVITTVFVFGGKVDFRGSAIGGTLHGYGGEFDATYCPTASIGAAVSAFAGFTYRDPHNVIGQAINLNGCKLSEVTLDLKKNLSFTLGSPSAPIME